MSSEAFEMIGRRLESIRKSICNISLIIFQRWSIFHWRVAGIFFNLRHKEMSPWMELKNHISCTKLPVLSWGIDEIFLLMILEMREKFISNNWSSWVSFFESSFNTWYVFLPFLWCVYRNHFSVSIRINPSGHSWGGLITFTVSESWSVPDSSDIVLSLKSLKASNAGVMYFSARSSLSISLWSLFKFCDVIDTPLRGDSRTIFFFV